MLCLLAALSVVSGCHSADSAQPNITVIDAGGHSVNESVVDSENESESEPASDSAELSRPSSEDSSVSVPVRTTKPAATSDNATSEPSISEPQPDEPQPEKPNVSEPPKSETTTAKATEKPAETTANTTTKKPEVTTTKPIETTAAEPVETPSKDFGTNSYTALNYSQVKGVWISYIELADMLTGKSESAFRAAIGAAYDNCVSLGLNTVYVHVRSHSDAYYKSELFPWSKYCTGTLGKAPDFDPLEIMIAEAHSRGLSFQAWINPLRACNTSEISGARGYAVGNWANSASTSGKYIVPVNGTYYLNPAYSEVTDYIAEGAAEIVSKYDVDGLHIDDYFYPTTDSSFDSAAFSESGYSTLSSFRFANCDRLVSSLYSSVKAANPSALFGVSCQGSMENNYNQMYADVKKWCSTKGFVDYIMPQIYYGFNNSAQPYKTCVSEWDTTASSGGIPLIVGLSVSKIGLEDTWAGAGKTEWQTEENILQRQLSYALEQGSYGGICLYSYRSVFTPESSVRDKVQKEIAALKAALN